MDEEKEIEQLIKQLEEESLEEISGGGSAYVNPHTLSLITLRKRLLEKGHERLANKYLERIDNELSKRQGE